MTLPRYLVAKGGTEFEAKPLPCTRLGDDDARCAPVFPRLPSRKAVQAVGFFSSFFLRKNLRTKDV
jgi:hypothetical protein